MPVSQTVTTYESHRDIFASGDRVISTYTIDTQYVTEVTLADGRSRKVLWEGQVLALNPTTQKAVPNYTSYGFSALGVLAQHVDVEDGDREAPVAFRGDIKEDYCTDNGTFGTVLAATKTTLADRIQFVTETRL